jgi:hypothetical protein
MTMNDDPPEPPVVVAAVQHAQHTVEQFSKLLQALGWDSIVISLTRWIEVAPGEWQAPGATATVIDRDRCGPVIPQIADVLRKQADLLDAQWGRDDVCEGYIQDATVYSSGCTEWPR